MTIIIPMAGLSSRFTKVGYNLPKYMLYVKDKSLFSLAVSSFEKYFKTCRFVFIARDVYDTESFVKAECELLGISDYMVVILDAPTRGQAETVLKGIDKANVPVDEKILIFNIDTFRPGFVFPEKIDEWDGYIECFVGNGANWSYAKTEDGTSKTKVVETAEKKEISSFCSTGIYYFKKTQDFLYAYEKNDNEPPNGVKELYVAPLYNILISEGRNIYVNIIKNEEVTFCGV
ncbi:MAG: hypothetical protein KBT27_08755, partial [Prevotellaceae bacterium]|nr:hypothetical protein [Candidatus Faecinaster equi]